MEKKVFKGSINGVKYDNVEEYSRDLQKLSKEGVDINETTAEYVTTRYEETKDETKAETKEVNVESLGLFPYFEEDDEYYLDRESLTIDKAAQHFTEFFKKLPEKLKMLTPIQLNSYKETIKDIYNCILSDKEFAENKIEKYQDELEKLKKDLVKMIEYKRKIDYFEKAYDGLHADVSSFLKILNTKKPRKLVSKRNGICDGKCVCNGECECDGKCVCNGECECGGKCVCNGECECKKQAERQYDTSASVKQLIDELFDGDISDFCNKLFR